MSHDYLLREVMAEDAPALAQLAFDTFFDTFGHLYPQSDIDAFTLVAYTPEIWAAEIADPDIAIQIAVRGDDMIGYLRAGLHKLPFDPGPRRAVELKNLYVVPAVKGQGVAGALMDWTLNWALENMRADDLYLGVYSGNIRAQRFYARYGFDKVGEYFFPVGETRDHEFILRKRLR